MRAQATQPSSKILLAVWLTVVAVPGRAAPVVSCRRVCTSCRYALPRERAMFRLLPSPSATTTRSIIQRIMDNRAAFEARNAKKVASEAAYYTTSKDYVKEV